MNACPGKEENHECPVGLTSAYDTHHLISTVARIEAKVDSLSDAMTEHKKDFKRLEERVWSLNTSKLSTTGVVALMTVIGSITAAVGTVFPHVFGHL